LSTKCFVLFIVGAIEDTILNYSELLLRKLVIVYKKMRVLPLASLAIGIGGVVRIALEQGAEKV
jgi:hypothetical protein